MTLCTTDRFHDACGVFGIYSHPEAATMTYLGLHALQHRGQESAGIVTADGNQFFIHRSMGLVQDVFNRNRLVQLKGSAAIGHVRYSTSGGSSLKNAQPFAVEYAHGSLAVCHNGNLINAEEIREELEAVGSLFQSTSDTEVLVHLVARSRESTFEDRIADALDRVQGAYSLLFLTDNALVGVRDPFGIRPLCLGAFAGNPQTFVFSSEPNAFELIGANHIRDVEPGEMVITDQQGLRSIFLKRPSQKKLCVFEYIYFARPDSSLHGRVVYEVRKALGRTLAEEYPVDADVIVPVPDSGLPAAIGYAATLKIPFEMGLIRSHYVGRTFIEPQQSIRHFGVRLKLSPVRKLLEGKRVVLVDDSLIRGTTAHKIVEMVRQVGVKEVHLRISSPPTRWPCYYGIDMPNREELIAAQASIEEIRAFLQVDSIQYLSLEGMARAVAGAQGDPNSFCHACFSGDYLYPVTSSPSQKRQLRLVGL
ncbi:amidophosphoribosyltransferase [Pajaroellobacter abortibovis]|uniref:Amidophosphoribosyltransferase n=1 Tax=Pajaroellobacter abortibovis TaxID=1882918 RepID=A0A1L6MZU6_9BACT|nr:amidophosphoribosyltransferase [Pajaroellobacter abortibovis]